MKKISAALLIVLMGCVLVFLPGCNTLIKAFSGEEETTPVFETSLTALPDSKAAVVDYYNRLLTLAADGTAGLTRDTKYEINDLETVSRALEGVTDDAGNQQSDDSLKTLNAAAKELRAYIARAIKSHSESVAFGENWDALAPAGVLNPAYATDAECAMGEKETNAGDTQIVYDDKYNGAIYFGAEEYPLPLGSIVGSVFVYPDEAEIRAELAKLNAYFVLEDYDCVFENSKIEFSANRITDRIERANYTSDIRVTAHVKGAGSLASYGELTVFFTLTCRNNYTFDWTDPKALTTEA